MCVGSLYERACVYECGRVWLRDCRILCVHVCLVYVSARERVRAYKVSRMRVIVCTDTHPEGSLSRQTWTSQLETDLRQRLSAVPVRAWADPERNLLLGLRVCGAWFFFVSNNWNCRQKGGLEGDMEGGAWDFLIKLPSVIFGLPLSWDPRKNLHMIFTSQIFRASLALIFIYLFARRNLNQTERHKSKTFECSAKIN